MDIRVSPDELEQTASKFENLARELDNVRKSMKSANDQLQASWNGKGAEKFNNFFEEMNSTITSFIGNVPELSKDLRTAAENYRGADNA